MAKITALGLGWKTRKILKIKPMTEIKVQLVDTGKLLEELTGEGNGSSKVFAEKMAGQYPILRARFIKMFW